MNTAAAEKPKATKQKSPLGKVKSLGPKEVWEAALLLPDSWDDLTRVFDNFNYGFEDKQKVLLRGRLQGELSTRFTNGLPRLNGTIVDQYGQQIRFSAFGDTRDLETAIKATAQDLSLFGAISFYQGNAQLNNIEVPHSRWIGRLRPVYPSKPKVIKGDAVRERIGPLLRESIPVAAKHIINELQLPESILARFCKDPALDTVAKIITAAHYPRTLVQGQMAQAALELMAAYRGIQIAKSHGSVDIGQAKPTPRPIEDGQHWITQLPFTLSENQLNCIGEIISEMKSGEKPMRRLLTGDVGYGKTAVFGVAAAAMYAAGGRVAVMLPNETLAEQAFRELSGLWPEAADDMCLVTGSADEKTDLSSYQWLVGTTALLFRDPGEFHLVIVDEQQKFSREQRESMLGEGTHLLEATATCIPRSQALMQFGGYTCSVLSVPPVARDIKTKIRYGFDRQDLFSDVKATLNAGDQVLVVYPKRAADEDEAEAAEGPGIHDVETAAAAWERIAPGQVRLAHGGRSETDNEQALLDMREGRAKVLVATTVVEVGVNIPRLRRVVIVHPHRFGLSTLHQIRGRAARTGGVGYCDLYLIDLPGEKSIERLRILESTQNGFEVARQDLMIRGCGNLSAGSNQQSGADDTILFHRPLTPRRLEQAALMEPKICQLLP